MTTGHLASDLEAALHIAMATVPAGFVVGATVVTGRAWVRIDDAPVPAILPSRIIRFGNSLTYSVGRDDLTYPPTVIAVIDGIRTALSATGLDDVDISLSHAAAQRQVARIIAISRSGHGRMRLASLLTATGLDEDAVSRQLACLARIL